MGDELTRLLEVFHKIKKAGGQATLSVASAGGKTKIKLEIVTTAAPPIVSYRDALGSVFLLWGRAGQGRNPRGGVTVKLGAFSGWGRVGRGSLENFRGRGVLGQPFSPGPGRGRAGRASLVETLSIVGPVKPEIIKMWAARSIFHRI